MQSEIDWTLTLIVLSLFFQAEQTDDVCSATYLV